jgi:hypothetical protein
VLILNICSPSNSKTHRFGSTVRRYTPGVLKAEALGADGSTVVATSSKSSCGVAAEIKLRCGTALSTEAFVHMASTHGFIHMAPTHGFVHTGGSEAPHSCLRSHGPHSCLRSHGPPHVLVHMAPTYVFVYSIAHHLLCGGRSPIALRCCPMSWLP